MMKKVFVLTLALMLALTPAIASAATLTMGSWRDDDMERMNALLTVYLEHSGDEIIFQPTSPEDYNATLSLQLDMGTGPDLMFARPYEAGREKYAAGYFADCSGIEGLQESFPASSLAPWQNADGSVFAVPYAGVSHVMYYNMDVFDEHGLEAPTTWEAFLSVCDALKEAGVTPLANGLAGGGAEGQDILENFFLGMLPNYTGGAEERAGYESGEKKLNDEAFVAAYTDFASLRPYLPGDFETVTYSDSRSLFASGRAAMFMDGSWSCGDYSDVDFAWSAFAVPAREGSETRVCFHPDMAITYNTATGFPEAAEAFLVWLCSEEGATEAAKALPTGYFPMVRAAIELDDPHANAILALNEGKETDARFVWPALMDLYDPLREGIVALLKGEMTPQEIADSIAALAAG